MSKKFFQSLKENNFALLIIIIGSICWSVTMVKSGVFYSYGLGFWGPNGHDGVWHIALSAGLARGDWQMPVFAGEEIKNYHVGFDLFLAAIHKITLIPLQNLYFQMLPPVFALLSGVFAYLYIYNWTKSKNAALWALFFLYFGGSFGWAITLFRNGVLQGESLFWSQQSVSTLVNPPFALSLVIIFVGLNILQKGLASNDKKLLIVATFLFGILIQVKVYAGILVLAGLLGAGIYEMLGRRGATLFKVFTGSAIISAVIFLPVVGSASGSLTFQPFWFIESMMQLSDRVGWTRFGEAMANYKTGQVWFKYIASYSLAFLIFIVGNFGIRILSLVWYTNKFSNIKKLGYLDVFTVTLISLGIFIPTFFVQSGTPWNTIQFFYYSLIFSGLITGIAVDRLPKNKAFSTIIILLTIPTTVGTLWFDYLPGRPPAKVSAEEFDALNYLKARSKGIVLTYPYDRDKAKEAESNPPRPLFLYESTAYVSAFSDKPVFLEDEVNLNITGYDFRTRRKIVENWYRETNMLEARKFLADNEIKYIYWVKGKDDSTSQRALLGESQLGLLKVYENNSVTVYEVSDM